MDIELVVKDGPSLGQALAIPDAREVKIGSASTADLALTKDPLVSRYHCVINVAGNNAWLRDADSTRGTYLNSRHTRESPLASGDLITVGETTIEVWISEDTHDRQRPSHPYQIPGYTLVKPLAVHGARRVYLAVPDAATRPVMLHMLHFVPLAEVKENPKEASRMQHQEAALARLQHERRIPDLLQIGMTEDAMWFATSYLDGISLAEHVAQNGPLPPSTALSFAWQAADILSHVHAAGIIHRGLDPHSFWISLRDDELDVYLIDLATARWTELQGTITTSTRGRMPNPYIAPELLINFRRADERSDIYSLAAVMNFAINGHAPGETDEHDLGLPIPSPGPVPMPDGAPSQEAISRYLSIIERAMAAKPADRITSAAAIRDGLLPLSSPPGGGGKRPPLTYLDFDLLIERGTGPDEYQARVLNAPGGQTSPVPFTAPCSRAELQDFLQSIDKARWAARAAYTPGFTQAKKFGGRLYKALFTQPVESNLYGSLAAARARAAGLRLLLRMSDVPELAELPWEFLYDEQRDRFLCTSKETPVVRFLAVPDPVRSAVTSAPIRILVVIATPSDHPALDVQDEWARLQQALRPMTSAGLVELHLLARGTVCALSQRLHSEDWQVLHFIGHGDIDPNDRTSRLAFEDEDGGGHGVDGETLGMILHDHRFRLVVLNACNTARGNADNPFAGIAQALLRQGVPSVLAMQFPITDAAAITLTQNLYQELANGNSVEAALSIARQALWISSNKIEWATPVLYSRATTDYLIALGLSIPTESDRLFRLNPIADSDRFRSPIGGVS